MKWYFMDELQSFKNERLASQYNNSNSNMKENFLEKDIKLSKIKKKLFKHKEYKIWHWYCINWNKKSAS